MKTQPQFLRATVCLAALCSLAVASTGEAAEAECSAASCLRATSTAMASVNRTGTDADEQFFMSKPAPPNLMFVLDTSGSMMDLPIPPSRFEEHERGDGCNNPVYDALLEAGGFSMSKSYPPPDLGVAPDEWGGDDGFPNLFQENRFYRYRGWNEKNATSYTAEDACRSVGTGPGHDGSVTNRRQRCVWCVKNKGYYLDTDGSWSNDWRADDHQVFSGKFLNFYPPKYVVARTVLKRVIWNLRYVRFGLTVFDYNTGGKLVQGMNPPCDKALNPEDSSWTNNRKARISDINGLTFGSWTPIAETLLNVGQYFSTDDSVYDDWFGSGWTKSEFRNSSITSESRSICWGCQVSAVVLITDGAPANDNCVPECIQRQNVTCAGCDQQDQGCGGSCPSKCGNNSNCRTGGSKSCCTAGENYLDDVAKWLAEHDLQVKNPGNGKWSADGRQKLITYTVGFGLDHPLLQNAAMVSGASYYTAQDRDRKSVV